MGWTERPKRCCSGMLLKYAGALVLVLAIVVECDVGHQCVLCGGDCPSGGWTAIANSTEAAALCAIDVESEKDECDDGCDDSAETCTIMEKLWNVIGASDECRAFKSGMEELERGKQNQVKRVLRIAYRRLRRVELCEARAAAKADGIHNCQNRALNVAPVEGYMKWALATAGTLYCSKCAAVDFAYCGLLTARNPGQNTCTVQCNTNWRDATTDAAKMLQCSVMARSAQDVAAAHPHQKADDLLSLLDVAQRSKARDFTCW